MNGSKYRDTINTQLLLFDKKLYLLKISKKQRHEYIIIFAATSGLPCHGRRTVRASSSSSTTGGETGEGLEIQPQLANIIIHFAKSKCTGSRSCRSVGASITRILDVGSIC